MYINAHAFLLPLYLHICVFLWKTVIHHVPCSSSSPSSSVLMQPHIIPNLSPSLPLSEPLCPHYSPPSYNDLVITGAAFPALVSRGVWGLIGTEWVWVAVRPDWHRTGIQGYPLQELYYRVYIQALTLKNSTSTDKKCFKHTNTCMFLCVVYSKTLYFSLLLLLSCFIHKMCKNMFFAPPARAICQTGIDCKFLNPWFQKKRHKKGIWCQLILEDSIHLIHLLRTFISDQSSVEMSICNTCEEIAQFLYLLFFFYLNISVDCMFWAFKLFIRIEAHLSKEWVGLCLEQWWRPVWFYCKSGKG